MDSQRETSERQHGRLQEGLRLLRVDASTDQQQQLLEFVALLLKWNAVYNLTAVRDAADMLVVHVLDALSILDLIDRHAGHGCLDVGSGAGVPAIPLAILRPRLTIHSVDAVGKKVGFQLQVKAALRLTNLQPHHARVESLELPEVPSVIVSRAFSEIAPMLTAVAHLSDRRTTIIAMKGQVPTTELNALPYGWTVDRVETLDVPFLGAQRCAVVLAQTP